jgi:hypothetical protein
MTKGPARLGATVLLGLITLVLSEAPRAAQELEVATRLRAYVAAYEADIGTVIAEEEFVQFIRGGPNVRRRHLVSEVGFLRLPGNLDWIGHRSVRTVDGRPVRADAPRLVDLFSSGGADLRTRALAIAAENAQYNLGYPRTINLPTLPLDLLHPRRQASFDMTADGTERIGDRVLVRLRFLEHEPGSIIAASPTAFNRAEVRAWVDPETGALHRAHVRLRAPGPSRVENQITVRFEPDAALGLLVPVTLSEVFYFSGYGSGEATYRNFRRFGTSARIVPPPG